MVLVGAKTYTLLKLGTEPITQGQTIEVDSDVAAHLESQFNVDKAFGKRAIFVPPTHERAIQFAKNKEQAAQTQQTTTRRRRGTGT